MKKFIIYFVLIILILIIINSFSKISIENYVDSKNIDYNIIDVTTKGDTGNPGIKGTKGPGGPSGIRGPTGLTGPEGIKGPPGIQGSIGQLKEKCRNIRGKCGDNITRFFNLGSLTNISKTELNKPNKQNGFCVDKNGIDINDKISKHPNKYISEDECLNWCFSDNSITGCERIVNQTNKGCYKHKNPAVYKGNNVKNHSCWINNNRSYSNNITECPRNFYQNGFGIERCNKYGMRLNLRCCELGKIDNKKTSKYGDRGSIGPKGPSGDPGPYLPPKKSYFNKCQPKKPEPPAYVPRKGIFSGSYVGRNYTVTPIKHVRDNSILIYAIHNHIYTKMVGFKIIKNTVRRLDGRAKRGFFPLNATSISSTGDTSPSTLRGINNTQYNIRFL